MKNNIQLIASDLDGTLLGSDYKIPANSAYILSEAKRQGKHMVLATGRHYLNVKQIAGQAGIEVYFITSNGAQVHTPEGKLLAEHFLPSAAIKQIVDRAAAYPNINTNLYAKDIWYVARETEWIKQHHKSIHMDYQVVDMQKPPAEHILKIYFTDITGKTEQLQRLEEELSVLFGDHINVCFSSPGCLEVMAGGISKQQGLEDIAGELGLSLDQCIAFGDGMNDVEMLSSVGVGVLMGTASSRVKCALPEAHLIGSSEEEAVAAFIQNSVLLSA